MDPELVPAVAHANDQPITKDWLESAYEWDAKKEYGKDATYYSLTIKDGVLLTVHERGQVWLSADERSEDVAIGTCVSRGLLRDLVCTLQAIA